MAVLFSRTQKKQQQRKLCSIVKLSGKPLTSYMTCTCLSPEMCGIAMEGFRVGRRSDYLVCAKVLSAAASSSDATVGFAVGFSSPRKAPPLSSP